DTRPVFCPGCKEQIGSVVMIGGVDYLLIGGGIASEWHGVCARCGQGFHWSSKDLVLEKRVKGEK
ncbi:MAG: hypothetical protein ABFD29_03860, partial [Anaerolineaceae bacterium]